MLEPLIAVTFAVLILVILGTCLALTALTAFRGIKRLRFSLGTLVSTVFTGALCVTLLTYARDSAAFLIGALLTTVFLTVISTHILGLGALSDAEYQQRRQEEHSGVHFR